MIEIVMDSSSIDETVELAGSLAAAAGWHEDRPDPELNPRQHAQWLGNKLLLIVSEVVEAHDEIRDGRNTVDVYHGEKGKPEGFPVELADTVIRLFDLWHTECGSHSLQQLIVEKLQFNATRGRKHGKAF